VRAWLIAVGDVLSSGPERQLILQKTITRSGFVESDAVFCKTLTSSHARTFYKLKVSCDAVVSKTTARFNPWTTRMRDVKGQYQALTSLWKSQRPVVITPFFNWSGWHTGKNHVSVPVYLQHHASHDRSLNACPVAVGSMSQGEKMGLDWHWSERPFRSRNNTCSRQRLLVGGGSIPKPGEPLWRHCGVFVSFEMSCQNLIVRF